MQPELLPLGFGNLVAARRIVAILPGTSGARMAFSSPTSRLIAAAKDQGKLVDMTNGRRTKAVIVLDTGHIALAAVSPRTLARRYGTEAEHLAMTEEPDEEE